MSAQAMTAASKKQTTNTKKPMAAEVLSLERLIRDGPDGDLIGSLEITRLKILDQGIKSDGDGMASPFIHAFMSGIADYPKVLSSHICVAHTAERTLNGDK